MLFWKLKPCKLWQQQIRLQFRRQRENMWNKHPPSFEMEMENYQLLLNLCSYDISMWALRMWREATVPASGKWTHTVHINNLKSPDVLILKLPYVKTVAIFSPSEDIKLHLQCFSHSGNANPCWDDSLPVLLRAGSAPRLLCRCKSHFTVTLSEWDLTPLDWQFGVLLQKWWEESFFNSNLRFTMRIMVYL